MHCRTVESRLMLSRPQHRGLLRTVPCYGHGHLCRMRGYLMEEWFCRLRPLQRLLAFSGARFASLTCHLNWADHSHEEALPTPSSPSKLRGHMLSSLHALSTNQYYSSSRISPATRQPASWVATSLSRPATRARGTRAATEPGKLRRALTVQDSSTTKSNH